MANALSKIVQVVIRAVDETGTTIKKVTENLGKVSKQSEKNATSQNKLSKATDKSTEALDKQGRAAGKTGVVLDKHGTKSDKARTKSVKLKKVIKQTTNELEKLRTKTSGASIGITGIITAVSALTATLGTLAFPIVKAATFERAMATVGAVSGATGEELVALTAKAREMGSKTEYSATQAAEGLKYLAMAGLNVEQQLAALEPALNLALAGNLELGRAADIATNVMTGFGASVKELPGMMDVLTQAFTSSNTTLEELGYGMAYVAPVAAGLGVKFNDLVSGMSALANAGIKGSMAGTSLRGMLVKLFSPSTKAAKIMQSLAERIGQTNIELTDAEGSFVGFVGLLEQFEAANISATDAMTIFGLRAGPAFIAMLNQGSVEMKRFNKLMDEATGRTAEIARIMGNNLVGAGKQLKSAFEELSINFGTIFLGTLKKAALGIRDTIVVINEWVTANKPLVKSIGGLVVKLGGLAIALGVFTLLKKVTNFALKSFLKMIKLASIKTAALIGSIIVIAATWGEFIYEMVKANGDFQESVENWDFAKWLNNLTVPFTQGKKTISDFVMSSIAFWDKLFSTIGYGFAIIPLKLKEALANALGSFGDFAQEVTNTITTIPALGKLLGWATDATGVQSVIDGIRSKAEQMKQEIIVGQAEADRAYKSSIGYANQVLNIIEQTGQAREKEVALSAYIAQREVVSAKMRVAAQKEIKEATTEINEEIDKQNKVLRTLYEQVGKAGERYDTFVTQAKTALKGLGEVTKKALAGIWENVSNDKVVSDLASQLQAMEREYEKYSDQQKANAIKSEQDIAKARITAVAEGVKQSIVLIEEQHKRQIVLLNEQKEKEIGVAKATITDIEVLRKKLIQVEKKNAADIISVSEKTLTQKKTLYEKATVALKAELDKSLTAEKSIADQIIGIQEKIRQSKMSTEELVRNLRRKGMSEESAYADEVAEVDEKIAAATKLMATDTKQAIQLLQEAQRQASGLAGEISKGDQVLVHEQETINRAISQVQEAQKAIEKGAKSYEESLQSQFTAQKQNTDGIIQQLDTVQGKLSETRNQMAQGVELTINVNVGDFEDRLKDITKQRTVVVNLETEFAEGKAKLKVLQGDLVAATEPIVVKYEVMTTKALHALDEIEKKKLGIAEVTEVIKVDVDGKGVIAAYDVIYESGEKVKHLLETPIPISADTAKAITELAELRKVLDPILEEISRQEEFGFDVSEARIAIKDFEGDTEGLKIKLDELGVISFEPLIQEVNKADQEVVEFVDSVEKADPVLTVDVDVDDSKVDEVVEKVDELDGKVTASDHSIIPDATKVLAAISEIKRPTSSTHTIYVKKVSKKAIGGFVEGIEGYAKGGSVGMAFKRLSQPYIPGDGNEDNVPAMLMRGEYVIKKDAVKKVGVGFLNQLNQLSNIAIPGFAEGGFAGMSAPLTLLPTIASGAMSRLKRKMFMKEAPMEIIFRKDAPEFNSLINNSLQNVRTPMGKSIAQGVINKFTGGVQKLQSGGFLSQSRVLYDQEKRAITTQYNAQIDFAKASGEEQIVYLLQTEQEELQRLVDNLALTLTQLQYEYETALTEAEATFTEKKTKIEDTLGDLGLSVDEQKFALDKNYNLEVSEIDSELSLLKTQIKANQKKSKPYVFSFPGYRSFAYKRDKKQQEAFDAIPLDEAEVKKLEKKLRTNERDYETEAEFLSRIMSTAEQRGERDVNIINSEKQLLEDDATHTYTYGADKVEKETEHEKKKVQRDTKHEVVVSQLDTDKLVSEYESDLKRELLAIERALLEEEKAEAERRAAESTTGGLKHFLAAGGSALPRKQKWIPGDGNRDEVPAMLMRGEYVIRKQAVKKFGIGFFDMLNSGMLNMERFATGGLAGFKRKMELMVDPTMPYRNKDGVVMNINNPSFVEHVKNTVSPLSNTGQKHSVNLLGSFRRGAMALQEGGSITQAEKDLTIERGLITAEYSAEIEAAKNIGAADIAIILEEERYELEQLAADLEFTLIQLRDEYEYLKTQILLQQEEEKTAIQAEFEAITGDLRAQRSQAEFAYEMAKTEAKRVKEQGIWDSLMATGMPITTPRPAVQYYASTAMTRLTQTERAKEDESYFEKDKQLKEAKAAATSAARQLKAEGIAMGRIATSEYQSTVTNLGTEQRAADSQYVGNIRNAEQIALNDTNKATNDFERETDSTKVKNEIEVEGVKGKTIAEVAMAEASLAGDVAKLQAQLARELFELEKSYRTEKASMSGVRHFLREGGSIGFPAGAQRGVDSIHAMITPGEYIMNPEAVKKFGVNFMDTINRLKLPVKYFAEGGLASGVQSLATPDIIKSLDPEFAAKIILNLGGKEFAMRTKTDVGKELVKEFRTLGLAVAR